MLYVYAADHGTGAGPALLEAVVDPAESAALWVADPNPRAQAFYRKHGFVADGTAQIEDGCGVHGPRRAAQWVVRIGGGPLAAAEELCAAARWVKDRRPR